MGAMTHSLVKSGFLVSVVDLSHHEGEIGDGDNVGMAEESTPNRNEDAMRRGMTPLRLIQIAIKIGRGGATSSSPHIAVLYM
jgi:hypothetical protein